MFGFLIRKTFYDLWDNMFRIVLINLGFIALVAIPVLLPSLIDSLALEIIIRSVGILCCSAYLAAAALSVKSISDYGSFGFGDFLRNLKSAWPAGLMMGFFVFVIFIMLVIVIPFYMGINSPLGLVLAAFVFWTVVFGLLAFQFYFAIRARLGTNLYKIFKKSLIIFFDNTGMAVFSLLHNLIALLISALLAFLFPGPGGILLFLDEALRLRLLKYDWLEANPGADRRKIPWDELLIDEREKTGTRSFRNFIFPWKD
jgi:hypothetical protein